MAGACLDDLGALIDPDENLSELDREILRLIAERKSQVVDA
jgi:chorismate mutase